MKRQFQVGDTVERIEPHDVVATGTIAEVERVDGYGWVRLKGFSGTQHAPEFLRLVKPAWTPQQGEMILVWNKAGEQELACPRTFIAIDRGRYVCRVNDDGGNLCMSWLCAKPLPKTHTITFADSTTAEISQEQYDALRSGQ